MKNEINEFSSFEIQESQEFISSLCGEKGLLTRNRFDNITDENFGHHIDLRKTLRGNFYYCHFHSTEFNNFDCSDYYFELCDFEKCCAKNSSFDYLGMIDSSIENSNQFTNTSFKYAVIENSKIKDISIKGCNFQSMRVTNCDIANIKLEACDFTGTIFSNCTFEDFSALDIDIQYVEFQQTTVKNVSFLIEDILHCFNGIEMIKKNHTEVKLKLFDDSPEISGSLFIESLNKMIPYLLSINDYFALANIHLYFQSSQKAYKYILLGLQYELEQRDFKVIRYLCKLAALTPLFSRNDLKNLYFALESNEISSKLTRFEYKRYINELSEIKDILIYNPSSETQMTITIRTGIDEYDYNDLSKIIEVIDEASNAIIPQTIKNVSIRHNSSPIIDIFLNGNWANLVSYFALLCACFGVSAKYIKEIYNILILHEDLKDKKLKNRLNEIELKNKQLQIMLNNKELENKEIENKMLINKLNEAERSYNCQRKTSMNGREVTALNYSLSETNSNIPQQARQITININN